MGNSISSKLGLTINIETRVLCYPKHLQKEGGGGQRNIH